VSRVQADWHCLLRLAQRMGEKSDEYHRNAFPSTTDRDEVYALTLYYPKRWRVEEVFPTHQTLA